MRRTCGIVHECLVADGAFPAFVHPASAANVSATKTAFRMKVPYPARHSRGHAPHLENRPAMKQARSAEIGVFGGSGFYSLIEDAHETWIETPYGAPSDRVSLGEIAGKRVAFLPRHGNDHRFPPQAINYRANLYAMKTLGVKWIIGPTAAGSLAKGVAPGSMVVSDQLVDRTSGRKDTFYDGPITTHVSFADPYCPTLRPIAIDVLKAQGVETHERGTVVVIQGPRFSTRSESKWFQSQGWEVINMTQYTEAYLARELEM